MNLRDRIVEIISESGVGYVEKSRTIHTTCPSCGKDDKFSIIKENGSCICYRGSCSFGKAWFATWVSLTFNISLTEAKMMVSGQKKRTADIDIKSGLHLDLNLVDPFDLDKDPTEELLKGIKPIPFPEFHMVPMSDTDALDGLEYLEGRGVTKETAEKYEIHYSKTYRRVYLPIKMSGTFYGYQGRHIDKVDDSFRIRNNEGFSRETLVMFADNLIGSEHAILAEGPFDAIKFDRAGGNVSSMGKIVTDKQIAIIKSYGISKLYLALDDDAAAEMNGIVDRVSAVFDLFKIDLPQACVERCSLKGKKPDFGECTMDEAYEAFLNAKPWGISKVLLYLK